MALTLNELMEKLLREDEVSLLEILNIDSEMIVERFQDIIEDRQETIRQELEEE